MKTTGALLVSLFSRVNLLAWAVLALALGATLLAWYNLRHSQTESATRQFELLTEELSQDIVKRMEEQESILLGAAGLLDASEEVSRAEWRTPSACDWTNATRASRAWALPRCWRRSNGRHSRAKYAPRDSPTSARTRPASVNATR